MTGLLRVKLRRDLRASWSRLLLMVLGIAISLTVLGGALFTWAATGRETTSAYTGTDPASATILLDRPLTAEQMATITTEARTRPQVLEATGRARFESDAAVNGQAREIPLQVAVAAPGDRMRMATVDVQRSSWPPAPGEILIREDSLGLLGVAVGDTVAIRTPRGDPVGLRVADTVYDPSLSPAAQHQTGHGYLSSASLARLGQPAVLDQVSIQVADPGRATPSRDRAAVAAVAGDLGAWLQRHHGLAIREIQVPEPYAHPHQWQVDALLGSVLAGAAAAVALSTILVANMLGNLFARQIPQIGIMKAIGARTVRIARLYLALTLLVAAAATVLALAPAILIGRAGTSAVLGFLGIQPASLAAPWWTYPLILAVGLGLPPLMALIPLVRTSRTTVRAAIDHHGLGSTPSAATGVLARLSRVRRLDRGLLMALRNTVRRPARFWLCVGLLATAGTVFVAGMSLTTGVEAIEEQRKAQRSWDVEVQLAGPVPTDELTTLMSRTPGVTRVEGWFHEQSSVNRARDDGATGSGQIPVTGTYPDQGHGAASVTAIPAGTTLLSPPTMLEGRWLSPGEAGAVVLDQIVRNDLVAGVRAGDSVELVVDGQTTTWRVVGIVQERGGGGGVYATAGGFAEAVDRPQRANWLRIVTDTHDEQTRRTVAVAVDRVLTGAGIEVESAASISRGNTISEAHLTPVLVILLGIALPLGLVGGIGLASTMSANVLDRTREFGVMHAIGARPKTVHRIVVAEGVLLGLASCVVAAIPALGLTAVLGAGLGNLFIDAPLPFRVSLLAVGLWIAFVVLGAVVATAAAATRASRLTVREALAYQ